ncbi:MAG: helix-turn-helix domain-containing protein [Nitrospinae bacterium]|nr:helix-turn-helix domain-containing protein [Nitrospinota bacterium]MBL7021088.1 helix-turn-helix domain-containing protein [Nitrospinaceae bacterium]
MVENFGSYLKHERELRGVPLEEISGATKIHIRFLKALEENSFDELPGEVFIKGYIRSYADIIGSDVEEMLNIYKESVEFKNQGVTPSPTPSLVTRSKTFLTFGLLILVVVGLVFGVRFLIKKGGNAEEKKVSLIQKQATIPEPPIISTVSKNLVVEKITDVQEAGSAEPETPELSASLPDQFAPQEDLDKKKVSSQQELTELQAPPDLNEQTSSTSLADLGPQNSADKEKPLKLTIRAHENSWFNMTVDDFREEDFILPAGTAKTFGGNSNFRLTVGNKTGVELSLNGKVLTLPESTDRVVKDFIINSKLVE